MLLGYEDSRSPDGAWGDGFGHMIGGIVFSKAPFLSAELAIPVIGALYADPDALTDPQRLEQIADEVLPPIVWSQIEKDPPHGTAAIRLTTDGIFVSCRPVTAMAGEPVSIVVVGKSDLDHPLELLANDAVLPIPANGVAMVSVELETQVHTLQIRCEEQAVSVAAVERFPSATLLLSSSDVGNWSVRTGDGKGWFPEDAVEKWDIHDRPYFPGSNARLHVPAGAELEVSFSRGLEWRPCSTTVVCDADRETSLKLEAERLIDPAASGWFGADLHVHMNYGGTNIIGPESARLMQEAQGLHFMNLVAGNSAGDLVYDHQLLESGSDFLSEMSTQDMLTSVGAEYRNDLLGHFHVTGRDVSLSQYYSGFHGSTYPYDYPPNSSIAHEAAAAGAAVGYCHPVFGMGDFTDETGPEAAFLMPHSMESREAVVGAVLGFVHSIDLISPADPEASSVLFRMLLGTGLRLAATVGTDTMLSISRYGSMSNPPGWGRVYVNTGGELTVGALIDGIRAGRTIVTNGPWMSFTVNGREPGETVALDCAAEVDVRVTVSSDVDRVRVFGSDGLVAESGPLTSNEHLAWHLPIEQSGYLVAVADGPRTESVLDHRAFVHSSPVHLEVPGTHARREHAVRWCLRWLELFEDLVRREGRFEEETQLLHHLDLIATATEKLRSGDLPAWSE